MLCVVAIALGAVSCCRDCDCYGSPGGADNWVWYHTEVEATYDREWYIGPTPRGIETVAQELARIWLNTDSLVLPLPEGLRVGIYGDGGLLDDSNLPTHGGILNMTAETTDLLFYNNDTEYIVFASTEKFDDAYATTRERNPGYSITNPALGSDSAALRLRSQPDLLYRAALRSSAVDSALYVLSRDPETVYPIPVRLTPAVYTYVFSFGFVSGLEYVVNASAALSGVSAGVNISTGRTIDERCTVSFGCTKKANGLVGFVKSFGAPGYIPNDEHYGPSGRFGIKLQLVLTNGKRMAFDVDISPQIISQPAGGVVMLSGFKVEAEDAKPSGGGAFDVTVDPWGSPTDYEIIF